MVSVAPQGQQLQGAKRSHSGLRQGLYHFWSWRQALAVTLV